METQAATTGAQALADFGAQNWQTTQFLVQAENYQAQQQRAQDVLDSTLSLHEGLRRYQEAQAERQQGDYRTLPQDVERIGKDIFAQVALERKLTPQAKALLAEKSAPVITQAQHAALGVKTKRFEEEKVFGMSTAVSQVQDAAMRARDDGELGMILDGFKGTLSEWVSAGILRGGEAGSLYQKTKQVVEKERVSQAIQTDPTAMKLQLFNQMNQRPTSTALPLAPADSVAQSHQEAVQVEHQRMGQIEHAERVADHKFKREQDENANALRAVISDIPGTPADVGQYQRLRADVNNFAQGPKPKIDGHTQRELLHELRTLEAAARSPRTHDDYQTENDLIIKIDAASNNRDYEAVRAQVIQSASLLKAETRQSMLGTIRERQRQDHWTQLPGVREGFRIIMGSDVAESSFLAMQRGGLREDERIQLRKTLEAYRSRVQELADINVKQADREAPAIAQELFESTMVPAAKERKLKHLPLQLRGADGKTVPSTLEEVRGILARDRNLTDALKYKWEKQWEDYIKTGATPKSAPLGTGVEEPSSGRRPKQPQ